MQKAWIIFVVMLLFACSNKKDFTPVFNVPAEFVPVIDSFEAAAMQRGYNITVNNLIIQYDSTLENSYCANANITASSNDVQKIIALNANIKCWLNSRQLETLIFHEMGHCILGREHDESRLPNGNPKSIMCTGNIALYAPCAYPVNDSCNQYYKRNYYLDELFNASTPLPDWGK